MIRFSLLKKRLFTIAILFSLTPVVQAHIQFQIMAPGQCVQLPGDWEGTGTAVFMLGQTCEYAGVGSIKATNASSSTFQAILDLESISDGCPKEASMTLDGTCDNETGLIHITSDEVELDGGPMDPDTMEIKLEGTVKYLFFIGDLTVELKKQ